MPASSSWVRRQSSRGWSGVRCRSSGSSPGRKHACPKEGDCESDAVCIGASRRVLGREPLDPRPLRPMCPPLRGWSSRLEPSGEREPGGGRSGGSGSEPRRERQDLAFSLEFVHAEKRETGHSPEYSSDDGFHAHDWRVHERARREAWRASPICRKVMSPPLKLSMRVQVMAQRCARTLAEMAARVRSGARTRTEVGRAWSAPESLG